MATSKRFGAATVFVMISCCTSACAPIAAIERRSGPGIVGTIDRSDAERLYVTVPNGGRYTIERTDVVDIDHPGGVTFAIGTICGGTGLGLLAVAPLIGDEAFVLRNMVYVAAVGHLVCAIPTLLASFSLWNRSRQAAEGAPLGNQLVAPAMPRLEGALP
jgi:hypothetical protein